MDLDHLIADLAEDVERSGVGANIGGCPCYSLVFLLPRLY